MHLADIIHGDLTTSNMMVRKASGQLVRGFRIIFLCKLDVLAGPDRLRAFVPFDTRGR